MSSTHRRYNVMLKEKHDVAWHTSVVAGAVPLGFARGYIAAIKSYYPCPDIRLQDYHTKTVLEEIPGNGPAVLSTEQNATTTGSNEAMDELRDRIRCLEQMISDEPRCSTLVPPMFQRFWESCNTLLEKADFKFIFRYVEKLENRIRELEGLRPGVKEKEKEKKEPSCEAPSR